jgi:hypothetical protein
MTLKGKGYYIWQVWNCEKGDAKAIAQKAKAAGLSHVLVKIADGTWAYNLEKKTQVDLVPPVIEACRKLGIEVWGWHYVRGDNPIGEARIAVQRSKALGIDGYVIDAEGEYQSSKKRGAAKRYMQELRAGLPELPIALSTYRFPRTHRPLPYAEFLAGCDYAMPQVYYEQAHNPEAQLERSVEQYMALNPARPVIPTAPAYARGSWRPTGEELHRFFQRAKDLGLSAVNAWSWDIASRSAYSDLWAAVAEFDWPPDPPPEPEFPEEVPLADMPERLLGRMSEGNHDLAAGLYSDNAAHVTGERTIFSRQAIANWYQELLKQELPKAQFEVTGKAGSEGTRHYTWSARSPRGEIADGSDTLGLHDGKIQFHFTNYTVRYPTG